MPFQYEHQMVELAELWLWRQGLMVKREFVLPWGVCDLVGCSFYARKVQQRLKLGQRKPIGPQSRVFLLSQIPHETEGRSITARGLVRRLGDYWDGKTVASDLKRLVRDRFVRETRRGAFQKLNGWMPLQKRLVTVELKLTRVAEVLEQATSNLGASAESYVALPISAAKRVVKDERMRHVSERRVGVLGIDRDKCCCLLEPAHVAEPDPVIEAHCVERFWRDYVTGN